MLSYDDITGGPAPTPKKTRAVYGWRSIAYDTTYSIGQTLDNGTRHHLLCCLMVLEWLCQRLRYRRSYNAPILGCLSIHTATICICRLLLHDWLYDTHIVTRKQADKEYLRLMFLLGSNFVRRYSFYLIVRLVGWIWWRNKMV